MSGIRAIGQGGSWVDYMKQNIDRFSSHEAGWVSQKWEEETKGKRQKIVPSAPHLLAAWWRQKSCQGDWDRVASEVGRNQGSQETLSINIPYFYQSSLSVNIRKHKLCDCLLVSLQPLVQTWNAEWRVSGCGLQGPLSFPLSLASRLIPLPGSRDLVKSDPTPNSFLTPATHPVDWGPHLPPGRTHPMLCCLHGVRQAHSYLQKWRRHIVFDTQNHNLCLALSRCSKVIVINEQSFFSLLQPILAFRFFASHLVLLNLFVLQQK